MSVSQMQLRLDMQSYFSFTLADEVGEAQRGQTVVTK